MAKSKNNRVIGLMDDLSDWQSSTAKLSDKMLNLSKEIDTLADKAAEIIGAATTLPNSQAKSFVTQKFNEIINTKLAAIISAMDQLDSNISELGQNNVSEILDYLGNMPIRSAFGNEEDETQDVMNMGAQAQNDADALVDPVSNDNTMIRNESYRIVKAKENGMEYAYTPKRVK